jgi:hypothetical protein
MYLTGTSREFARGGKPAETIRGNIVSGDGIGEPVIHDLLCPKIKDQDGKETGERRLIPGIPRHAIRDQLANLKASGERGLAISHKFVRDGVPHASAGEGAKK